MNVALERTIQLLYGYPDIVAGVQGRANMEGRRENEREKEKSCQSGAKAKEMDLLYSHQTEPNAPMPMGLRSWYRSGSSHTVLLSSTV